MKDTDRKRIQDLELWSYRRLLRSVIWVKMYTNEWIISKLERKQYFLHEIGKEKLSFVGHVIRNKGLRYDHLTVMVFG